MGEFEKLFHSNSQRILPHRPSVRGRKGGRVERGLTMMRSRSAWLETAVSVDEEDEVGGRSLVRRIRRPELDGGGGGEGSAMVR